MLETLETLLRISRDPGVEIRAQYWKGRVYEQLKQSTKAQAVYRNLLKDQPLTYYGQLAKSRLREALPPSPMGLVKTAMTSPASELSMVPKDLHFQKAQALVNLGLLPEASEELKAVPDGRELNREILPLCSL